MQPYHFAVVIGSFEPFHLGHQAAIDHALAIAEHAIVLIGSAHAARTPRHPWSAEEREAMVRAAYPDLDPRRLIVRRLADRLYNELQWITSVQEEIGRAVMDHVLTQQAPPLIAIVESAARAAAGRLAFPEWERVQIEHEPVPSAASLRACVFAGPSDLASLRQLQSAVPESAFAQLRAFMQGPHFAALAEEFRYIQRVRASWRDAPYPPVFVTTDAVLVHSGHILLVQRGHPPGKGLWALPGGFVGQEETIYESCLRELREETGLAIPAAALRAALEGQRVFDAPHRSERGRTITHAFFFHFPEGELPPIRAGDDAAQANWFRLARLPGMQSQMFEDHYHIVDWFLGGG
jgi:bifunctional NMN adenylyltransferase/nudix hydrolase